MSETTQNVDIVINNKLETSVTLDESEITLLLAYINKLIDIHKGLKIEKESE